MIRLTGIAIGIGALILSSSSLALAGVDTNQGVQKRAGGSLSNLENRSISKDFDEFFLEDSQTTTIYPEGSVRKRSQNQSETPLLDNIQIEIGDDSPNSSANIFPEFRNGDRSDSSQILYEVNEW